MSNLRASETMPGWGRPITPYATALRQILASVRKRKGLIHGRLQGRAGQHCAMGAFFADHGKAAVTLALSNEVAAVNDSAPKGTTAKQRRELVMNWLRFRIRAAATR